MKPCNERTSPRGEQQRVQSHIESSERIILGSQAKADCERDWGRFICLVGLQRFTFYMYCMKVQGTTRIPASYGPQRNHGS